MKIKDMLSYFNLTAQPFTKEISERELIMLPSFEKAFATTQLLVETRGIGLMVGQPGTGKSCVLRMLRNQLNFKLRSNQKTGKYIIILGILEMIVLNTFLNPNP